LGKVTDNIPFLKLAAILSVSTPSGTWKLRSRGEAQEDRLLMSSAIYGLWGANYIAFNDGDLVCRIAAEFMTFAEKQTATVPLLIGHRVMGASLLRAGEIAEGRWHNVAMVCASDLLPHLDQADLSPL
jgi:hypothetical protein